MTREQIIALIEEAIQEVAPGKVGSVNESNLNEQIRELGIDSVASMEMASIVEDELGVQFPDDELQQVATLNDLVKLALKHQ